MARRGLRGVALGVVALAGLAMAVPATNAYFRTSVPMAPIVLKVAPAPPSVPCPLADFGYGAAGTQPYAMLTVHVWAKNTLPADCSLSFSLNSYSTQGPDWPSSGTQTLLDHQTITLDAGHPSGTLTVKEPPCYGQTDFYSGSMRFDGVDGALPRYPDIVVPQPLLAWSNGGKGCMTSMLMSGPLGATGPADPSSPDPSPSPDPSAAPSDPPVLSSQPPVVASDPPVVATPDPPVVIAPPSPDPSASPDPTPSPSPVDTAAPVPTDSMAPADASSPAPAGS